MNESLKDFLVLSSLCRLFSFIVTGQLFVDWLKSTEPYNYEEKNLTAINIPCKHKINKILLIECVFSYNISELSQFYRGTATISEHSLTVTHLECATMRDLFMIIILE